jgi:PAS domain S-box-containing protein
MADLRLLLAAVEATGEAILITSAELDEPGPRIEYVNPAFTRMTGYEAAEVLGRTPRLLQGHPPARDLGRTSNPNAFSSF